MEKKQLKSDKWADVAGQLGTTRQTLYNWRKLPDAPTEPDVEAWKEWHEENKAGAGGAELSEVKRQVELEKLRKLRRENEVQEGRMIPVDEVVALIALASAKWDLVLTQKLETEGPARVVGKDIAEARIELRTMHDELRVTSKRLFEYKAAA